jgi:hypothetical protein
MILHSSAYQNSIVFIYVLRVQIIQSTNSLHTAFNMDTDWLIDGLRNQENDGTEDEILLR